MKLKAWEMSLVFAVIITVLWGAVLNSDSSALSDKLIRLHIIANSDSEEDQALKLDIRDKITEEIYPLLESAENKAEAESLVQKELPALCRTAEKEIKAQGYDYSVSACLTQERFPTRRYDTFSLPAGTYTSLRIVIGEGAGHNWWCVVFPPVCTAAAVEPGTRETMDLTDSEIGLITESGAGYTVKFRAIEILESLKSKLGL